MPKIDKMLEGKKSFISFIIHDEIVIDYCDEDRHMIDEIKKEFEFIALDLAIIIYNLSHYSNNAFKANICIAFFSYVI